MQNKIIFLAAAFLGFLFLNSCVSKPSYKNDGVYEGKSQSIYKSEPFLAESKVYIKQGKITKVDFQIVDTLKNEVFDEKYEKHFIGNKLYIDQCRNDWKGMRNYLRKLLKTQNIDNIDAVSGATWSYNMFKSSVSEALKNVKKNKD